MTEEGEEFTNAINKTLMKYCSELEYQDYANLYNLHHSIVDSNKDISPVTKCDQIVLCELNVGLWEKSLISAISSLTATTRPDTRIIQEFISYLLNAHPNTHFGLLEDFFYKLILLNPAKPEISKYYKTILSDCYVTLNGKYFEEIGLFDCLLQTLVNLLSYPENSMSEESVSNFDENKIFTKLTDDFYSNSLNLLSELQSKTHVIYFERLSWSEKKKRCLIAFSFAYNIFETDFAFKMNLNKMKCWASSENDRLLMSQILWPDKRNTGLMNKAVCDLLEIFVLSSKLKNNDFDSFNIIKKHVNLMAEIIRCCDKESETVYPFVGSKSHNLARELSIKLNTYLQDNTDKEVLLKIIDVIRILKPPWLRLLLCSYLLQYATGHQCLPELAGTHDILEYFVTFEECKNIEKEFELSRRSQPNIDPKILEKLKKLKNINMKRRGKTFLHWACEMDNVEEVKALLTCPDLDINAKDRDGFTALHWAARMGHATCVQQLLYQAPQAETSRVANTRMKGPGDMTPLMWAVTEGHIEVSRLLLEHSGSILLEDVDESNKTALEMSSNEEITRILRYYKKNFIRTSNNVLGDLKVRKEHRELVLSLCVEMIHAYFSTHRTLDIYNTYKNDLQNQDHRSEEITEKNSEWDYKRFHRDINSNVVKLAKLVPKLKFVPEFQSSYYIFTRLVSYML